MQVKCVLPYTKMNSSTSLLTLSKPPPPPRHLGALRISLISLAKLPPLVQSGCILKPPALLRLLSRVGRSFTRNI